MKLSQQSQSSIETAIRHAVGKFPCGCEPSTITDIHIQPNQNSGELLIFDDEDNELACSIIEEWLSYDGSDFYKSTERILCTVLHTMKENKEFEKLSILQPFSFVLVDEEKETIGELLLMDDDLLLVNEELLKGLDEELNNFLKELLEKE